MRPKNELKTLVADRNGEFKLHLFLAWGCPFCHRVYAAILITGLSPLVSITWTQNIKNSSGWKIGSGEDPLFGFTSLKEIYKNIAFEEGQKPSVPLLVDLEKRQFLSSDSMAITRLFTSGLNGRFPVKRNIAPESLINSINSCNEWLHKKINRQVYRVGFSTSQKEYEAKVEELFQALDYLEDLLACQPFLLGEQLTESDIYLFATLIRFDCVYYPLFKCSYRHIADYDALSSFMLRLRKVDHIESSFDEYLIRQHYFCSTMHVDGEERDLNPSRIIPAH